MSSRWNFDRICFYRINNRRTGFSLAYYYIFCNIQICAVVYINISDARYRSCFYSWVSNDCFQLSFITHWHVNRTVLISVQRVTVFTLVRTRRVSLTLCNLTPTTPSSGTLVRDSVKKCESEFGSICHDTLTNRRIYLPSALDITMKQFFHDTTCLTIGMLHYRAENASSWKKKQIE